MMAGTQAEPQPATQPARCPSCDGYGWFAAETAQDTTEDCGWCGGLGYVLRDERGVDRPIPPAEYGQLAETLERMDEQRLREMGYRGEAKAPPRPPDRADKQDP